MRFLVVPSGIYSEGHDFYRRHVFGAFSAEPRPPAYPCSSSISRGKGRQGIVCGEGARVWWARRR